MHLISHTAVEGRKGPTYAPIFPLPGGEPLYAITTFRNGPPHEEFARLRRAAPISWQEEPISGAGFWALTRYDDVMQVNPDAETFSSQRGGILMSAGRPEMRHPLLYRASMDTMINMDNPWHFQLRREHMPYFTPAYLNNLKERIAAEVTRLLDGIEGKATTDLVEDFSARLPLFTLCEILGVPEGDRDKFLTWMHYLEQAQHLVVQQAQGTLAIDEKLMAFIGAFNDNVAEMFAYGQAMLHKRRADPQADLMSAIARAQIDGHLLSDEYLDGSWLLIVFAGNDTTRNTLSGTMKLLTEFGDQKQRLLHDPSLIPGAVDEFIRMVSPVIYMRRTATKDTVVGGQKIAEGEKVIMYYGAANRDPSVFPDPDQLDVTRANASKHLAFGYGPHVCLGKRVAQIQLEEAYRQILNRFPAMRWTGEIEVAPNNFVYAISKLGVQVR
ncbi:MAG TPA: cytochrome P450 [Alphaproteobacteria bacterium]|nr:cytochrome P450 [Alphaproteobacteria bacterium]